MRHLLGLEEDIIPIEIVDEFDNINDELMTNTLWEAHLRAKEKIFFPEPSSDSKEY